MDRFTKLPLIKAVLKVLSNDSLIYAIVAIFTAMYLENHRYDEIITIGVLAFAAFIIGASEWRDIQGALSPFRDEIESGLTSLIHNTLTVTLPSGQEITLDFPDSMEPEAVAHLVKYLTGSEPADAA